MYGDGVLTLIGYGQKQDENGVWRETKIEREVFCKTQSVTRDEFFQGGRNGLNPEIQFSIFSGDYNGEVTCRFNGRNYGIYRTYLPADSDYIELYAERKGGLNAQNQNA